MSIFSRFKDNLLEYAASNKSLGLKFPLIKTGNIINNYTRGDFIVVGGRKTSGKSSFVLNNYVISPLLQWKKKSSTSGRFNLKVIYINTRKNPKSTMERMVVNYISTQNKGNKVGVPSLYGYDGTHTKLSKEMAKKALGKTMDVFDSYVNEGVLSVIVGKKSVFEIEELIQRAMEEYGTYDEDNGTFTYDDKYKDMIPIVAIDDITNITGERGGNNVRNDNAHQLAIKLKNLAKVLNIVVVLTVPSFGLNSKNAAVHQSTLDELAPYSTYADRTVILHNPLETEDKSTLDYRTAEFTNTKSGICYLRTAYIAANYMGASGVTLGYFMFPENGFILELPRADDVDMIDVFVEIVKGKQKTKDD